MKIQNASILLVDANTLIQEGIKHVIDRMTEIQSVTIATSGAEACALIRTTRFHLYILDLELPDITGFDLISFIQEHHPEANILINTMHKEIRIIKKLMQMNVRGAILKSDETNEIIAAVQHTLQGETYFCQRFEQILQRHHTLSSSFDCQPLTQRELEVLQAISKGLNTREIAELFHVSNNTIESHRKSLMTKFDAKNVVDLVVKAVSKGIIHIE